jgi:hypothetical protein
VDPYQRLPECVREIYGVDVRTFVPSGPGSNGNFIGNINGKTFSVENDVGSYTAAALGVISYKFHPIAGYTNGFSPYLNYTASDLQPVEAFALTQIHELGHSLDVIMSGNPFGTNEASAERLEDCLRRK